MFHISQTVRDSDKCSMSIAGILNIYSLLSERSSLYILKMPIHSVVLWIV